MKNYFQRLSALVIVYIICQVLVLFYGSRNNVSYVMDTKKTLISRSVFHSKLDIKHDSLTKTSTIYVDNRRHILKQYRNFTIKPPLFIDESSRILFNKNDKNRLAMIGRPNETLHGEIIIVNQGTIDVNLDCGYKSHRDWIRTGNKTQTEHWFQTLVPLVVPDGHTFQHFIDGTLPKIVQALPLLQNTSVKILMRPLRDKIILDLFKRLNISPSQLVFKKGSVYGADRLIYPCITPPLHPDLWQEARRALGAPAQLQLPLKLANIIYVTRAGSSNGGRLILNDQSLVQMLTDRYGSERLKVFKGPATLNDTIDLFGNARIILGPHGGGMYNINFAPLKTVVIEFMPTFDNGNMGAASDTIIWTMAQMLRQEYWRMCISPVDNNNMNVDLQLLTKILDVADQRLE